MTENELPSNLKSLWDKAVKSMRMQNYDYVAQLLTPIVKAEPSFLEARSALRKAQMAQLKVKKAGLLSGGAAMKAAMKLKSQVQADPLAALGAIEDELASAPGNKSLNELLYDEIIPRLFRQLYDLDESQQTEEHEVDLIKLPPNGYYEVTAAREA